MDITSVLGLHQPIQIRLEIFRLPPANLVALRPMIMLEARTNAMLAFRELVNLVQ